MSSQDLKNKALIGAWVSPPPGNFNNLNNPNFITLGQYKKIKKSGINTIYGLYENAEDDLASVLKALDLSNEVGIQYLVRDTRLMKSETKEEFIKYLNDYNYKKAYLGILLIDEPGVNDFKQIARLYQYFKEEFPDKLFYTNLLPMHAESHQFIHGNFGNQAERKVLSYKEYYDLYFKECKINYLSYDLYPFEQEFPAIRKDYFIQHQLMFQYYKKYKIPVYNFIQTCSFANHVRVPTKEEILWHVNTSIAFGVKGIQYFTYFIPIESTHETFNGSMIDMNGKETEIYYHVKSINEKITSNLNYLLDSEFQGVIQSFKMCYRIPKESLIKSNSIKNIIGDNLLIGIFKIHQVEVLYAVNVSLEKSGNYEIILNDNYHFMNETTNRKKFSLKCGDAILLQTVRGENG